MVDPIYVVHNTKAALDGKRAAFNLPDVGSTPTAVSKAPKPCPIMPLKVQHTARSYPKLPNKPSPELLDQIIHYLESRVGPIKPKLETEKEEQHG
ncbi:MAG: hypothetical protein JKX85_05225 [Phycisphaeraceae bacterium]|nr:hypothetical protein [Phycisphaeraceae bacterium]